MAIAPEQAVERLRREIQSLGWDDLREVYNELFRPKITVETAQQDPESIRDQINKYMDRGLGLGEIESLWNLLVGGEQYISFYNEIDNVFEFMKDWEWIW